MAAIIRFFTKRFRSTKTAPTHSQTEELFTVNKAKKNKKSDIECKVNYLDGTEQTFYLPKCAVGSNLYDIAYSYVALVEERDYFGLQMFHKILMWLDPTKEIRKQCKGEPPYNFSVKVKFFPSNPQNLHDEYTRYLVVLHLREEIRSGRLPCQDLNLAADLSALLLHAEFGNYDPRQHTPVFVSTFRFLPEDQQTEEFEIDVLSKYKTLSNLLPSVAESLYLEKARTLPRYGVQMYDVKGKNKEDYALGLTPTGILVYEGDTKIGLFYWPNILELKMNGSKLKIIVNHEDESTRTVTQHAFCFVLPNNRSCKTLWKSAVEHHTFFRLINHMPIQTRKPSFFRMRSRFQASFNTEYQMHTSYMYGSTSMRKKKSPLQTSESFRDNQTTTQSSSTPSKGLQRSVSSFRRAPSKRFNSRNSFKKRELILHGGRSRQDKVSRRMDNTSNTSSSPCPSSPESMKNPENQSANPSQPGDTSLKRFNLPPIPKKHPQNLPTQQKQNKNKECFEYTV